MVADGLAPIWHQDIWNQLDNVVWSASITIAQCDAICLLWVQNLKKHFTFVTVVLYAIPCYIGPRYIDSIVST